MYDNFDEFWINEIEQNVTADRAKRFAKAAWDYQQKRIDTIRASAAQCGQQATLDEANDWGSQYD